MKTSKKIRQKELTQICATIFFSIYFLKKYDFLNRKKKIILHFYHVFDYQNHRFFWKFVFIEPIIVHKNYCYLINGTLYLLAKKQDEDEKNVSNGREEKCKKVK